MNLYNHAGLMKWIEGALYDLEAGRLNQRGTRGE
jgi:hypothetical protein